MSEMAENSQEVPHGFGPQEGLALLGANIEPHTPASNAIERVPVYLLERSIKRRQELELGRQILEEAIVAEPAKAPANNFGNALLSLGLSEQFNDCSIAAASVCNAVQEQMKGANKREDLVFLGEDGSYASMWTRDLGPEFSLPSKRRIKFVLGREDAGTEAPTYLFAVTRGNLALRLASFQRRESNIVCDYVQLGHEMEEENYIVVPSDESLSRLDVIERIKMLVMHPVVNVDDTSTWSDTTDTFRSGLVPGYVSEQSFTRYHLFLELSRLGIIKDDKLERTWLNENPLGSWVNRRRNDAYQKAISFAVDKELHNFANKPIVEKNERRLYYLDVDLLHAIIKKYRQQQVTTPEAVAIASSLDVDPALDELLGSTTDELERLFAGKNLPKCAATGAVRGVRPDVKIGKITGDSEFELFVEPIGKSGYRVSVSGRPTVMRDRSFAHMYTTDFYRDRAPSKEALASASDVLDLLKYVRE